MYPNLFYLSYFIFLCNCFLKFVVHKMNHEMFKSIMVVLNKREETDVADADMTVS
jgi:hypothetical protein